MNEPNKSDLPNQDGSPPSKNRLSILDLMLMMAAFALAMALRQNLQSMQFFLTSQDPFFRAVSYFHYVVFVGLTFWGLMLLVRSRLNATKQSVWHPGHLMLIMVFIGIAAMPTRMLSFGLAGEENATSNQAYQNFVAIFLIAVLLLPFLVALAGALTWRWSWSWVRSWFLLTLSSLLTLAMHCLILALNYSILPQEFYIYLSVTGLASGCFSLLAVVFVVIAMVIDLRKGTPRDAAHWIGIVCWFGWSICPTAFMTIMALGFV